MATTSWKVTSGNWSLKASWSDGVPGTADTALINDATVLLIVGTIQAAVLDLNPTTALTFNLTKVAFDPALTQMTGPVTLNANGSLDVAGTTNVGNVGTAAALVVNIKPSNTNFSPEFTNSGTMVLTGGAGSTLGINPATAANPTFDNAGVLTVGSGGALNDDENNINQLTGVFLNAGTLSFAGDAANPVNTQGNFDDGVQNSGTIVVDGGGSLDPNLTFVDFLGTLSGSGSVQLRDGTMFEAQGDAGGTVQFAGDRGVIQVDEPTPEPVFGATLDGFGFSDVVRYTQPILSLQYSGSTSSGALTVTFAGGGSQQLSFANIPSTDFTHHAISVSDDEVVIACFAAGTRILTDAGERAVEALRVGDAVVTLLGGRLARVRWIGQRRLRGPLAWPVRIAAHALGENQPRRDLLLSPDHAVHVDGALVPVRHLTNGGSVARCEVADVVYYHLELDRHEVVIAEGLACESYLDTGNRSAFEARASQWIPACAGMTGTC
jgi:hypothetical protein